MPGTENLFTLRRSGRSVCESFYSVGIDWKERGIRVTQRTSFPESVYRIPFRYEKTAEVYAHLRYPSWAQAGYTLAVNGQPVGEETEPGQYLTISRKWAPGDEVTYVLKQTVRSEGILGDSTVRAYLNGPVVLAAPLADEQAVPVIVSERLTGCRAYREESGGRIAF